MNQLDQTFQALADPTRRAILARLALGSATVGELSEPFDISLPAVSRHLKVLEDAALIENRREGKHRRCNLRPEALKDAFEHLERYARFWTGSFDRLDAFLKQNPEMKTMSTLTDAPVLIVKRIFDAAPARVFDAWLEHEQFKSWIGPEGVTCEVPVFEPRVGGRYRIVMKMSDGRIVPVAGTFKTLDRPKGFSMTWKWEDGEDDSLVTVLLRDLGGKTELTLRHDGLLTAENRDGHEKGWNSTLNKLGRLLAGANT